MHSIQKLRWQRILKEYAPQGDLTFEWVKMVFEPGQGRNDRDGLYVTGPYGKAEVSPLPGYFEDEFKCLESAINTVTTPWPSPVRDEVKINLLVSKDADLETLDKDAPAVKVKVRNLSDCDRAIKVREILGPNVPIRIDCNGIFNHDEAIDIIRFLDDISLEFVEQPCATIFECGRVRQSVQVPIAIDETARTFEDIEQIKELKAADIVVLKIQPTGGLVRAYDLAKQWGGPVTVTTMMETEVGRSVAIALAMRVENLSHACGLAPSPIDNIIVEPIDY